MMGRDHVLSGVVAGLAVVAVARLAGAPLSPVDAALLVAVTAGAALWPDLDHPSATVARAFRPLSVGTAVLLDRFGVAVYAMTATARDDPIESGHRTVTHTLAWAIGSGALTWAVGAWWPVWGPLAVVWLMVSLALRAMLTRARGIRWALVMAGAAALTGAAWLFSDRSIDPGLLAAAVALGSFTHCLGDSCTVHGCPWLWPVPIRRRTWYRIGTPRWMRFRTGTEEVDGEDYLRMAMWVAVVLLLAYSTGLAQWLWARA